ncbi:MAG: nitroreductase family protein [Anaerolineaceae bacterium]|nr:nitroreductase family protein [Anaerolineaceae bacterium]
MQFENNLYEAFLTRTSKRRYEKQSLGEDVLAQLPSIISRITPLIYENKFDTLIQNVETGENLADKVGGYGRIVNPPHYLVPYLVGEHHTLVDLGCRVQQIVIRLTAMGIGTCYLGCIQRQDEVRRTHNLPDDAEIGAFLIFGKPSISLSGKAVNTLIHSIAGADNKLPIEKIFFLERFDNPGTPPRMKSPCWSKPLAGHHPQSMRSPGVYSGRMDNCTFLLHATTSAMETARIIVSMIAASVSEISHWHWKRKA